MTSIKEFNEDFLVIPIKYLKSQLENDEENLSEESSNKQNEKQLDSGQERAPQIEAKDADLEGKESTNYCLKPSCGNVIFLALKP